MYYSFVSKLLIVTKMIRVKDAYTYFRYLSAKLIQNSSETNMTEKQSFLCPTAIVFHVWNIQCMGHFVVVSFGFEYYIIIVYFLLLIYSRGKHRFNIFI